VHATLALLSAALLSATGMTDAEVRAHVEALLGAIDRPVPSGRWKALGPAAATVLADAEGAPLTVRETAVRVLGRMLPPARLRSALAPVLRAAPDAGLRAVAAETLARHAPAMACAEVMDQASLEVAVERAAFERAAALCSRR
jgi:hypothetical protein